MKQTSASGVEAWVNCAASHVLPQHNVHSERSTGGTGGHAVLAAAINDKPVFALPKADLDRVKRFPLGEILQGVDCKRAEAAFVINYVDRTSAFIGVDIDRKYEEVLGRPLTLEEIPVSIDVDGIKAPRPWSVDWKFGTWSTEWQRRIQAMALAWHHRATEVDAGFVYIDGETGGEVYTEDRRIYYAYELNGFAMELRAAAYRVHALHEQVTRGTLPMANVPTVEGPWCTYCGAYPHCPSKWKLAKSMLDELGADDGAVAAMTVEQCGRLWAKWKEIKRMGEERIESVLKGRMREEALPLPNGKVVRLVTAKGRESIDRDAAIVLLKAKGATDEEIAKVIKRGNPYETVKEMKP